MQPRSYKIWIRKYVKKYWYLIAVLLIMSLGAVFFELISPLPLKFLADNVFGNFKAPFFLGTFSKTQLLVVASIGYIAIYGMQALYSMFQSLVARKFNQVIDRATLNESQDAVTSIPYNDMFRQESGTYVYQITSQSQQMSEYLLGSVISIIQSCLTLIGIIVVLAQLNLKIMLITFAIIPLLVICVVRFGKILEKRSNETETAHGKLYAFVDETLAKLRTVQAFALERRRKNQLQGLITVRNKMAFRQLLSSEYFDITTQLIILLGIAAAIYLGGQSVFAGAMTFGGLLIFISYTTDVFGSISNLIETYGGMKIQAASLQQAYDTITLADSRQLSSGTLKDPIVGKIEFKSVTINHGSQEILHDVDLTVMPGTITALIGLSGSGKTTLLNSLLRLETPLKGFVTIDDHDVRDYDVTYLREHIALVEQEPDLFLGTIAENISIANPDLQYNLPDIMGAAGISDSTEFIDKMPENYNTIIDNHRLSGGQKQRLAAARAYYKRAQIILMDEPTSALDKDAAQQFIDNVFSYFAGRTVILITHDLNLLKKISEIYVVKDHTVLPIEQYGGLVAYSQILGEVPNEPEAVVAPDVSTVS